MHICRGHFADCYTEGRHGLFWQVSRALLDADARKGIPKGK